MRMFTIKAWRLPVRCLSLLLVISCFISTSAWAASTPISISIASLPAVEADIWTTNTHDRGGSCESSSGLSAYRNVITGSGRRP